jgi:hypothetical protein
MKNAKGWMNGGALTAFALLALACGGIGEATMDGAYLHLNGQLYQRYLAKNKKPPSGPNDLLTVAFTKEEKDAVQAIEDDKLTIIWNVNLNDEKAFPDGKSNTVLGYANATFGGGSQIGVARQVLMADGKYTSLDDDDFQKRTKAVPADKGDKGDKGKEKKKGL